MKPLLLAFIAALATLSTTNAQRQVRDLVDNWKFLRQDTSPLEKIDSWTSVNVPHTWNTVDGANGKAADPQYPEGYYRGAGWYARTLDMPNDWKGKRVFIRLEGVATVADVFVNELPVGHHRGGYAAFCFELTPYLRFDGKDTLRVRADNSRFFDVAPLSGDFTIFGGIYRPVQLFATDTVCISPLKHGSPGVFLNVTDFKKDRATVDAKVLVANGGTANANVQLEFEVRDATGMSILKDTHVIDVSAGDTAEPTQKLVIQTPHLWHGRKDPYLYSVTVRVLRDGKVADAVTQPLGIRTVAITQEKGFLLNGAPYPLLGVNRHQELFGKGAAVSNADHEQDFEIIRELGATSVRLAHYQQVEKVHEISDRTGVILWQEIPLVDTVAGTPEFLENARQQLTEMILQGYNHPSIGMWGLFNELDASWAAVKTAPAVPVIEQLQKLAKELDPSRPTVCAAKPEDAGAKNKVPDWAAWNIYPGWYGGKPDNALKDIEKFSSQMGKRIGLSEYGAGANPLHFQEGELKDRPAPGGPFHPQEWQNYFHERLWAQIKGNPNLFGTWIWVMFDFAVDARNEGGIPGLNDKGLVTRDRKIKKDTFYFYKANWNAEPTLYISSRRMTPRRLASTAVKAYSNCAEVDLKVNGKSLGTRKPDEIKIVQWPEVTLQPGMNKIEVSAKADGRILTDSCEWELEGAPEAKAP